jgi:DNA-binding MarR family transcriptional regulator
MTDDIHVEGLITFFSRMIEAFIGLMRDNDLSLPQIYVLMYLYHQSECQVSDIARLLESSIPAASQMVDRLWQQGLVDREEDRENRRIKNSGLPHPVRLWSSEASHPMSS